MQLYLVLFRMWKILILIKPWVHLQSFLHYFCIASHAAVIMELLQVAYVRVSICPFVHQSVKCIGVCSHVSMSSKGFDQSPGAHLRVSVNSIIVTEMLISFYLVVIQNLCCF